MGAQAAHWMVSSYQFFFALTSHDPRLHYLNICLVIKTMILSHVSPDSLAVDSPSLEASSPLVALEDDNWISNVLDR
jgi:hypothetical protein